MSGVAAGIAGGTALLSAVQASDKAKRDAANQKLNMLANAAQMRYSPWSGMSAQFMPGQSIESPGGAALGAGLQGGLQGAMFGQQFAKGMKPAAQQQPTLYSGNDYSPMKRQSMYGNWGDIS